MLTKPHVSDVRAIAIGTSAGAIGALTSILPLLPKGMTVPVFVAVHLPAQRPSLLVQLFESKCEVPVREPFDKEAIGPGVWFAPPDYHLLIDADVFALSIDEAVNFSRPSIDVLFESAANAYREGLVAVLLTGASHDGAEGARAVREAGGFVVVQDPSTAEAAEMPRAGIERAKPQLVASLDRIASFLRDAALARTP